MMEQLREVLFRMCAALLLALFGLSVAPAAYAGDTEVHGYGYQGFLLSNKNTYLDAQEGTWAFNEVALQFSNHLDDRTTAWVQFAAAASEGFEFDWAFIDYRFTNELSGRVGQVNFPVGFYNEIRDNKMLHLTFLEPTMYRREVDIVFESYRGLALHYQGPLTVDLFGGAPVIEEDPLVVLEIKNLRGGRLTYQTPLEGLTLMASYAAFNEEQNPTAAGIAVGVPAIPEGYEKFVIGSVSYERGNLEIKTEHVSKEGIDEDLLSYYIEAGYTLGDKLTPYVGYDVILNKEEGVDKDNPQEYQKEIIVGLGYKVNPNFGFKVEERFISGYLMPIITGEIDPAAGDVGANHWNMFVVGMNFMF